LEIVSPKSGKYCPTPKAEGNISQTEGKQFPIVTDNTSLSLYLFCYTSNNTSSRPITTSDVNINHSFTSNNDVMLFM